LAAALSRIALLPRRRTAPRVTEDELLSEQPFQYEVSVIGLGRVGLPLALSFADRGLTTIGVDKDPERVATVKAAVMPFREEGTQELLERVMAGERFTLSPRIEDAAAARYIVLTLGTPNLWHIEIDISDIRSALDSLLPVLREGHHIVLRSTVAPGTTEFVAGYLEQQRGFEIGRDVFVAHAPERIAENHFIEEIATLPHIVGGVDEESTERVASLFEIFGPRIEKTTPVQAELAKIWTNIFRYTNFALPNLLMMNCEQYGANVFEVIDLINRDYPRGGIARPGLTGGTCLRKDFAFSEERSVAPGMLMSVSRVNESVPLFLVEGMKRRLGSLRGKKVAVLGLTFKRNSDDLRDSLAAKLVRLLERDLAKVVAHDPHAPVATDSLEDAVADACAVVVATNHDKFSEAEAFRVLSERTAAGCLVVDPWNAFGSAQVFAYVDEIVALGERSFHPPAGLSIDH
jgi:UDP-N-acetyl-D-mannosaminuronic acid dehydrogenase